MKILAMAALALILIAALIVGAGQFGLLAGSVPKHLGVENGRLQPPSSTPNSVSSQANLYPGHLQQAYAAMPALQYRGDGEAAMQKLEAVLKQYPRTVIVTRRPDYIYAQCSTPLLKFTDDVEFWLDKDAHAIQFRSASRLGRKDLGTNRARMEAIRARFES